MIDIDNDIFRLCDNEQFKPGRGMLLVAKPLIGDDIFSRSVIVLLDHDNEDGSLGLMVNFDTIVTLPEILPHWGCEREIPIFNGGPVHQATLMFLHTLGPDIIPQTIAVAPGLWCGGDYEAMQIYVKSGAPIEGKVKFFLGSCGWMPHQIDSEIKRCDWTVRPITDVDLIMSYDADSIWTTEVQKMGPRYRQWLNWPADVSFN